MEITLIHKFDPSVERRLDRIANALDVSNRIGASLMAAIDDLAAEVAQDTTVIGSAVTLISGLAEQIKAAGTDPKKLADLQAQLSASRTTLAAAVAANTPAAPVAPAAA